MAHLGTQCGEQLQRLLELYSDEQFANGVWHFVIENGILNDGQIQNPSVQS
jgi:hypothetical protein